MDKVSVIMPLYNSQSFVEAAVKSVQCQTYQNWELLIVDDASTDNSLAEARKFEKTDARIKVFASEKNRGVSASRNFAIKHASGRYVAFLDSDDLWSKHKLAKQIEFMKQNNAALSHTAYAFMNEDGKIKHSGKVNVDKNVDLAKYMKTTQIGMSSVMVDRRQIQTIHFPDDRKLCEDARVWMGYMREGYNFSGLNEVLSLYRIRDKQLSKNKVKMAANTLQRYWNEKNLPAYKRLYYFLHYACNGVEKRLRPTKLDMKTVIKNFENETER
ncbi:MAG: glycosyltransferase family 2 protein [Azospirillum sp.]|nr:glycosyltransferase family 2 protein [Azospirillum sp.]